MAVAANTMLTWEAVLKPLMAVLPAIIIARG